MKWSRFRFQGRLFLAISVLFLFIMIIAGILFYGYLYNSDLKNAERVFMEANRYTQEKLDDLVLKMDNLSSQLVANENIQNVFLNTLDYEDETYSYFDLNIEEKIKLNKECVAINTPSINKAIVHIYREPNIYYTTNPTLPDFQYICDLMENGVVKLDDDWAQTYYEVINPHQDYWTQGDTDIVLSMVRPLISTYTSRRKLATIEITEDYKKIQDICESNQSLEGIRFLVADHATGELVYPYGEISEEETDYYLNLQITESDGITAVSGYDGENEMVSMLRCEKANWSVFLIQPKVYFFKSMTDLTILLVVVFMIFLVLGFLAIYYVTNRMTQPIRELHKELSAVTLENVDIHIQKNTNNEILLFQKGLKDLLNRLQESANSLAKAQSAEYAAKLMALQAQINPHFLFNSLTAISAAGQEAKSSKVQIMCSQLGNLFRYASSDQEKKTLREELENVETYLEFSKWRYLDTLEYRIHYTGKPDEILVPRLLLQPIVENCIVHAYYHVLPPLKIDICCTVQPDFWKVVIEDNGGGASQEILERLQALIGGIDETIEQKKVGQMLDIQDKALVNVYARLRLTYGKEAIFQIDNTEKGFRVVVGGRLL